MSPKHVPQDSSQALNSKVFRTCFCFHVKTGTLVYGVFSVVMHLLLLGLLLLAAVHPDILAKQTSRTDDGIKLFDPPTQEKDFFGNPATHHDNPLQSRINRDNLCVAFAITLAWVVAVIALIYGVAKNVASYILPCFCLQVFDFCLTCLVVVSFFSPTHTRPMHWKMEDYPGLHFLHNVDPDFLKLMTVAFLILVLSMKAYIMGMVWSCYRYIQLFVASRAVVRHYTVNPDNQMLLPPSYEDAIKLSVEPPQPGNAA